MLDVAVAYNRYKFIGHEFLTWLWFAIEKEPNLFKSLDKNFVSLEVGNRIVLENNRKDATERITIKGEGAGLEEGILALQKGALVTELNLEYRSAEMQWQFTVKGESLNVSNLRVPQTGPLQSEEDLEGVVLEKAFLYDNILQFLEKTFKYFIKLRISNDWRQAVIPRVMRWIRTQENPLPGKL